MEITSIIEIWKWFKWLPDFVLKRIFTKKRLSELVYIDIKPRGEPVRVNLNETSSYEIWLQIINMSPYEIELDRAELNIYFSGERIKNKHIKKSRIKAGEISHLHISDAIDGGKAKVLNRQAQTGNDSYIDIYAVFNCKLHEFEKDGLHLNSIKVNYIGVKPEAKKNA